MRIHIFTTIATLACALAVHGQSTTKLSAAKINDYGIVYNLPTTVLDITIETEHVVRQPGEFANYANRCLNITDAVKEESADVRVKSVVINPRGIPNEKEQYLMQFKSGQNVYVVVDEQGLPIGINTEEAASANLEPLPKAVAAKPTALETPEARHAVTQDMILSSSTSKRASLAAERIFELRDSRNELIAGQAENMPKDGASLQLALDNISAQEAALTAMFAGTEKKWTEVHTITYVPGSEAVANEVVCRLSPVEGLVDADDLTGAPIYIDIAIMAKGELPTTEKGEARPFPKNGVAYNIPGVAEVAISVGGKKVATKQIELAQLGVAYGLDPKLFTDKKSPASLLLSPSTGAIVKLSSEE